MIYLSESALKYAANICEEFPGYKVGIALLQVSLSLRNNGCNIMRIIQDAITDIAITDIETIVCINGNRINRIKFSNGSTIRFIPTSDSSRGYAFNLLIVEYGIDEEFVNYVLRPCERVDYYLNHLKGQSVNRLKMLNKQNQILLAILKCLLFPCNNITINLKPNLEFKEARDLLTRAFDTKSAEISVEAIEVQFKNGSKIKIKNNLKRLTNDLNL